MKKLLCCVVASLMAMSVVASVIPVSAQQEIVETDTQISAIAVAPAVVVPLNAKEQAEDFALLNAELRPSNVIVQIDEQLNALDADGKVYASLSEIYAINAANGVLTVAYVKTKAEGESLSRWLSENDIYDITIMSDDATVVESVRERQPYIRGAVDYSAKEEFYAAKAVAESTHAYANIVMLSVEQADADTVFYLQARFKAVWVEAGSFDNFGTYSAVSSGALGIVTEQAPQEVYACFNDYSASALARPFNNIGHRGLGSDPDYPENTLEGCIAAYESGATMVEIDMYVSADDGIFIMHDPVLDRTTDGTGDAESKTLAELAQVHVLNSKREKFPIPTIDMLFSYFADKEDIVLNCEIKSSNPKIVELFGQKVEEYGVRDKVVVIAFELNMLKLMSETPSTRSIPTAWLNSFSNVSKPNNALTGFKMLQEANAVLDSQSSWKYMIERNLKSRGYLPYSWTYTTPTNANSVIQSGMFGVTNDIAAYFSKYPRKIIKKGTYYVKDEASLIDTTFEADIMLYDRTTITAECDVFRFTIRDGYAEVILHYNGSEDGGYDLYSEPFRVEFGETPAISGCGGSLNTAAIILSAFVILAAGCILVKKSQV